jgi:hypothetical protein
MLELTSEDDLNRLVEDEIQDSLTLEYKRSEALGRSSAQRDELSKDVSALANSAGGQLIYGIREENHLPVEVDGGVDNAVITREWIEQVLNSNIQPRLSKLIITPIKIADQRFAYVITVPASSTAHQAADRRYYRRFNFQSVAMYDYEIRDVMKRSTTAQPFIKLSFDSGSSKANARINADNADPVPLYVSMGNRSAEPAFHSLVTLGLDNQLTITDYGRFDKGALMRTSEGHRLNLLQKRISTPEHLPIFQEVELPLGDRPPCFSFVFRTPQDEYLIRCTVHTPGFTNREDWIIRRMGTNLTLDGPMPPLDDD